MSPTFIQAQLSAVIIETEILSRDDRWGRSNLNEPYLTGWKPLLLLIRTRLSKERGYSAKAEHIHSFEICCGLPHSPRMAPEYKRLKRRGSTASGVYISSRSPRDTPMISPQDPQSVNISTAIHDGHQNLPQTHSPRSLQEV